MYNGRTQNSTLFNLLTVDGQRFLSFSFQPASAGSPLFPQVFGTSLFWNRNSQKRTLSIPASGGGTVQFSGPSIN
jgi:hypothetical protein